MPLHATYDPEARALVVELADGTIAGTVAFPDEEHLADLDADGRVLSLEILSPGDLGLTDMAEHFHFEDRLDEIETAIEEALTPTTGVASAPVAFMSVHAFGRPRGAHGARSTSGATAASRELDLMPN